jgi:hypothetical protein
MAASGVSSTSCRRGGATPCTTSCRSSSSRCSFPSSARAPPSGKWAATRPSRDCRIPVRRRSGLPGRDGHRRSARQA